MTYSIFYEFILLLYNCKLEFVRKWNKDFKKLKKIIK